MGRLCLRLAVQRRGRCRGRITSGVVTCPLDVIKTKLQAQGVYRVLQDGRHVGQPRMYNGLSGTASVIWREEGIRGMYRGLGPIVMGYLPTWAVWFTVYNKSKVWMAQYSDNTHLVNFWSSIIAGASSTIVTNPIWVIKTRLMSQSHSPAPRPCTLHVSEAWQHPDRQTDAEPSLALPIYA
ncbi:hypothetical protein J3459_005938 [Metarhizium acridum]|nr:hypothetical protein J3459_005938 [Metarhizium acridum]